MKLTLVEKREEAKGTKSFFWKTDQPVNYLPGQFYYFTLPKLNYPDPRGATRHFTISSSLTEGATLRNTTRIREESGYKKSLNELQIGAEIEGDGPNGTFILNDNQDGVQIFLAGGIGITPFRSMIRYATDKKLKIPIYLIYSNSHTEEIAFKKELEQMTKDNPNFKVVMTVSKPEESLPAGKAGKVKWNGIVGRIDENLIQKLTSEWKLDIKNSTFWVCGPPAMTDAMEQVLGKLNINPGNIRSEKFTGY